MFHVRRKPADFFPRKRKKKPMMKDYASESALINEDKMPFLLEMNPGLHWINYLRIIKSPFKVFLLDGSDISPAQGRMPHRFRLQPNVTEVGSDPAIQVKKKCELFKDIQS